VGKTRCGRRWPRRADLPPQHPGRRCGRCRIWGKVRDKGFKDEDLKAIGESLDPGSSAIIAIAEDKVLERLETGLQGYNKIARHALSAEAAATISAEVEAEPLEIPKPKPPKSGPPPVS
jgi:uncharacterized membrane protein